MSRATEEARMDRAYIQGKKAASDHSGLSWERGIALCPYPLRDKYARNCWIAGFREVYNDLLNACG